jgi:hypothetical protein
VEILAELSPYDPVAAARVTLRVASADDKRITANGGNRWWPAITRKPTLRHDWFDGDFTGAIRSGGASLEVAISGLLRSNTNAARMLYAAAPVKLYEIDPAVGTSALIFDGIVSSFDAKDGQLSIVAEVNAAPFDAAALTASYAGTGGAEGPADLKGRVKPWCFGRALNIEPVLIDALNSVYQVSGYGPIQDIPALYERGSLFSASVANHANYAALVAATIPPGRWATCLASGMFRLGAPAAGLITADVDGDNTGGWLRKTGEIINRIALNAGVPAGSIDSASLAALDTAITTLCPTNSGRVALYFVAQTRLMEIAQTLARPCNAAAGITWEGQLFIARTVIGTAAVTLDAQGRQLPPVTSCKELSVSPPYWRIEMQGERNWRVQNPDEIATLAPLREVGDYAGATTYREGNIVVNQGARWLYINATPAAGNAPPTLPTTSNARWELLAGRGDFANLVGATKPEDNATAGDNAIINAALRTDTAGWNVGAGISRVAGLASDPSSYFQFAVGALRTATANGAALIPLNGAARVFLSAWVFREAASTGTLEFYIIWNRSDGDAIGDEIVSFWPSVANSWEARTGFATPIAGAAFYSVALRANVTGGIVNFASPRAAVTQLAATVGATWGTNLSNQPANLAGINAGEGSKLGGIEPGADVTASQQVSIAPIPAQAYAADFLGTLIGSLSPISVLVTRGGVSIKLDNGTSYAFTPSGGLTATVDNTNGSATKGDITPSALTSNYATGDLVVTVGGVAQPKQVIVFTRSIGSAPAPGGVGAKSASDSALASLTATSFTPISVVLTVTTTASESLYASGSIDYEISGSTAATRTATMKYQYSVAGANSWSDFTGGSATGSVAESGKFVAGEFIDPVIGNITVTRTQTTPGAGNWDVRLVAQQSASGRTMSFTGPALVQAKV